MCKHYYIPEPGLLNPQLTTSQKASRICVLKKPLKIISAQTALSAHYRYPTQTALDILLFFFNIYDRSVSHVAQSQRADETA